MTQSIPKILYKYRPWNLNTAKIVANNELYFSSPLDFNDPFDFKITPTTQGTTSEWRSYLESRFGKDEADRLIGLRKHEDPEFHQKMREDMIQRQARAGVLCLSKKNSDILMWSHYADSHKGVCLEFAWDSMLEKSYPLKVTYSPTVPQVSIFDPDYNKKIVDSCLLTKSIQWVYEEEFRAIIPNGKGVHRFPDRWLRGIILGCRMSDDDTQK